MNDIAKHELHALADRFWQFQQHEFPILAIQAGQPAAGDALLREAPADHERRAAWAEDAMAELAGIDAARLDADDRATHALLRHEFALLVDIVMTRAYLRPPLDLFGPDFVLTHWASATTLRTPADAKLYFARLSTISAGLAGVQEALASGVAAGLRYPRQIVQRVAGRLRAQLSQPLEKSAFYRPIAGILGAENLRSQGVVGTAAEGGRLIEEAVIPALRRYADFLEGKLLPATRATLACEDDLDGPAHYRFLIRQFATVDAEPEAIHATGLREVERITEEIRSVERDAGHAEDADGFRRALKADGRQFAETADALREQVEAIAEQVKAHIPRFFGRLPHGGYRVESVPTAMADAMPIAYIQPALADDSSPGVFWITSAPAKCPLYMLIPLTLHEAWPGHLMHLALIHEMEHLPAFRRYGALRYSACLEGWALYVESLGEEMGFYDTPEKRYGRLEGELFRALRLVVDTGLHVKGWSRDRAIEFLTQHLAMPVAALSAEVDRYVALPAQALGYQLGNLQFRQIRTQSAGELGERFRIADFHDALMAAGPVTLPVLEQIMHHWRSNKMLETADTELIAIFPD